MCFHLALISSLHSLVHFSEIMAESLAGLTDFFVTFEVPSCNTLGYSGTLWSPLIPSPTTQFHVDIACGICYSKNKSCYVKFFVTNMAVTMLKSGALLYAKIENEFNIPK